MPGCCSSKATQNRLTTSEAMIMSEQGIFVTRLAKWCI